MTRLEYLLTWFKIEIKRTKVKLNKHSTRPILTCILFWVHIYKSADQEKSCWPGGHFLPCGQIKDVIAVVNREEKVKRRWSWPPDRADFSWPTGQQNFWSQIGVRCASLGRSRPWGRGRSIVTRCTKRRKINDWRSREGVGLHKRWRRWLEHNKLTLWVSRRWFNLMYVKDMTKRSDFFTEQSD